LKEIWKAFNEWLKEKYGGWDEILKIAFDKGVQAAVAALEAAKDEIVEICKENNVLLEQLAKFSTKTCVGSVATKQVLKTAVDLSVQQGTKQATTQAAIKLVPAKAIKSGTAQATAKVFAGETAKSGTKQAVKLATVQATKSVTTEAVKATAIKAPTQTVIQATKLVAAKPVASAMSATMTAVSSMATPLSIGTGIAQAGLEEMGYNRVGKTVGATGSMAGGAMVGFAAGPAGVAVGAAAGAGVWILGEIVGRLVDRAFGARSTSNAQDDVERIQSIASGSGGESSECTSREDQNPRQRKGIYHILNFDL
jgi:hypothetical protein